MIFTSHNIKLNNGHCTIGADKILLADSAMWTSIAKSISLFIGKDCTGLRAVDLGCLEGGYSAELAKLGFDTLGIEARQENINKCNYVKDNLDLPNLNFVTDDVRNLGQYGKFDVTVCYGLLYHLNDPAAFLKTISDCTTKVLFLNTHFAPERDLRYRFSSLNRYLIAPIQKRTKLFEYQQNYRLSPMTHNEGYTGRWYREWSKNAGKEKIEKMLWASYNNNKSFWLRKKDLTKAIHAAGFKSVFEQFDYTGDLSPDNYTFRFNRTMFVAVKH